MTKADDDIADGREQEGKPRHLRITPRQRARILRAFEKALKQSDERTFLAAIRELGLKDGSAEFAHAFRVWREFRRDNP